MILQIYKVWKILNMFLLAYCTYYVAQWLIEKIVKYSSEKNNFIGPNERI